MPLTPGSRLGNYEIVAAVGAGGMGEVYRSRDPRLNRDVAIKVLAPQLASDPVAVGRFEREAMSVARLSHPNILSIFEFVHDHETPFVVTEFVEGDTLRVRLEGGPLPARRAVAYALQIARGMAAAHARGIVHRDLKPENVMVTHDDRVKILDFGLAKPVETPALDKTLATGVATAAGIVVGTFGYMAPEQVRGLDVDHRADMFAFGAVLYEMLSGERAFKGETAADTMSAILSKEPPDLDIAKLSISPGLDRIVRRCLEKSPDLRFQSANDLAFALETLASPSSSSAAPVESPVVPRRRASWLPWAVAAAAVTAAAVIAVVSASSPGSIFAGRADEAEARWSSFTRVSELAGEETSPTLSPDGSTVAYAVEVNGSWDIYAQRVGGRNATAIVNDPQRDEKGAVFSPDGTQLAFHISDATGGIFIAGATGESVRRITDGGFDPTWSPDGQQIAYATEEVNDPASRLGISTLYVTALAGGARRKLVNGDGVQPAWSPSGARIAYWSNVGGQRDLYTAAAGGGTPVRVTNDPAIDWSPSWSPDGRFIYFSSDRGTAMNLWRIAVDEASGAVLGRPEPVTAGVQASAALPRLSKDGSRLVFRSRVASVNPAAVPFDPVTLRAGTPVLLDTRNNIRIPSSVSPDGKQIAYFSLGEQQEDLFIGAPDGPMRRLTDDAPRDRSPVFTPDGRSLVFYSNRGGRWEPWIIGIDGGGLRKIAEAPREAVYVAVSPKGDRIVFNSDSAQQLFTAPLTPGVSIATELPGVETGGKYFGVTDWSKDGLRLAGPLGSASNLPVGVGVYDIAARRTSVLTDDTTFAVRWLADGRRLVYFTDGGARLIAFDTATRTRTSVDVRLPGPSIDDMFAISPDNRVIYYGTSRAEADIWIVERR
jgi:Tol biopolymer transport system component/serine/threonine protein kinase